MGIGRPRCPEHLSFQTFRAVINHYVQRHTEILCHDYVLRDEIPCTLANNQVPKVTRKPHYEKRRYLRRNEVPASSESRGISPWKTRPGRPLPEPRTIGNLQSQFTDITKDYEFGKWLFCAISPLRGVIPVSRRLS